MSYLSGTNEVECWTQESPSSPRRKEEEATPINEEVEEETTTISKNVAINMYVCKYFYSQFYLDISYLPLRASNQSFVERVVLSICKNINAL